MALLLVGYDGSPPSRRAFERALARGKGMHDAILVVSVLPPGVRESSLSRMMPAGIALPETLNGTFEQHTRERLEEVLATAKAAGVQARGEVRTGSPVECLLAAAREAKADEIILGAKSYEGPDKEVGPNAEQIASRAQIPVTLVP
ncbi:MAG: hypothetical protein QOE90_1224 [Thermoplasmata archaeon]|jgi:nucleotide-binding universal stress UspA family protein|nr:hypothetical protein [Thermoplasmata archaeon]